MKYLVTGANRGLGLEFTTKLAERGDEVIATCRSIAAAKELQELAERSGGKVRLFEMDVATPADNQKLAAFLEGQAVDVLINNAGHYSKDNGPFDTIDFDGIMKDFAINAMGSLRVTQAALPAIRRGGLKKIINISSKMGSIADNSGGGAYAYRMSKTALNMGSRSLAQDLKPEGITVLAVHPGWVVTDMGGPNGLVDTNESINGLIKVIDNAGLEQSGRFWDFRGEELPW